MPYTRQQMLDLGGKPWSQGDKDRIYLNNWDELARGISVSRYNTGNVSSFTIDGHTVANSRVHSILGRVRSVYWDAADSLIQIQHNDARDIPIRYKSVIEGRDHEPSIDLVQRIFDGIRKAVTKETGK